VWPGEFVGLKFKLNSEDKALAKLVKINLFLGFLNQKILGIHKIVSKALNQFNLTPTHITIGSKIENKFVIILYNKFLLKLNKI